MCLSNSVTLTLNVSLLSFFEKYHALKKRKDSLGGSLDGVLFVVELKFLKILAPTTTFIIFWDFLMF